MEPKRDDGPVPHVVIVGGGFGGLYAARQLHSAPVRITLVDSRNHHLFQPLLYQVATAALNPSDIAQPLRSILRNQKNTSVILAAAESVDLDQHLLLLDSGAPLAFDYLIVATGATHSYFGHDEWSADAPGLKSIEDALDIRRRILLAYEAAERELDPVVQKELMTFVVVGAGPTGVELAGAMAEISRHALSRDFRRIDPRDARILLVEGGPRVLPAYTEASSASAVRQLEGLGVEVRTSTPVTSIDPGGVTIGSERIAARTVLWAAGVRASALVRSLGAPLDRAGRVEVQADLSIPNDPNVFVVGDAASLHWKDGFVPGVAPAAMQAGRHAAKNISLSLAGKARKDFVYLDKGSLATIGRAAAVAEFRRFRLSGFIAWSAWLTIHIFFLIGFRNRALVLLEWAWAYFTYDKGARLITGAAGSREVPGSVTTGRSR